MTRKKDFKAQKTFKSGMLTTLKIDRGDNHYKKSGGVERTVERKYGAGPAANGDDGINPFRREDEKALKSQHGRHQTS